MKTLATLRQFLVLIVFAMAAATASAEDGSKKTRKNSKKQNVERTTLAPQPAQRRQVAAFVDPTLPLAEMVERIRSERAQ